MVNSKTRKHKTVLDPYMGSGTTLVACEKLGLNGTGIEINKEYYEKACDRVAEATREPDLFSLSQISLSKFLYNYKTLVRTHETLQITRR